MCDTAPPREGAEQQPRSTAASGVNSASTEAAGSGSVHLSVQSQDERPGELFSDRGSGSSKANKSEEKSKQPPSKEVKVRRRSSSSAAGGVRRRRSVASTTQLKKVSSFKGSGGGSLEDESFYHGFMAREEAERILTKQGEFVVRKTEVKKEECTVVSVRWNDVIKHLRIQLTKHKKHVWINEFCFESVPDLIRYHHQQREPVHKSGILLVQSVQREMWQLYHEQVSLGKKLGSGEFGEVLAGTLTLGLFSKPLPVAVKTLKAGKLSGDDRVTFLREANVMLKLNHRHVIRLYGVATQQEPIMIVMEVAPGGSLLERVRRDDRASPDTKRKYCKQIVSGMAYLEEQQVIHRDLAARNCLLNKADEAKISDFGLSLLGKLHKELKMLKVPVRWLAPETLSSGIYSSKSDVWSFGVLMFEVFSDGATPYSECKNLRDVRRRVNKDGLRLTAPDGMASSDQTIMKNCFETEPKNRNSFADLKTKYAALCPEGLLPKLSNFFSK